MKINQILNTTHDIPVILAPMAGVTDLSFREICMEHQCSFTYSEMVSAKAISYNNQKTFRLLSHSEKAMPFGVQLFGHEPEIMAQTSQKLCEEYEGIISLIDINMGCPAPKIVNNGDGSALMKDMPLASKIIEAIVKAVNIPVTVKFRKGFDENTINAVEFAKMAEDSGASAIAIHGRTRAQMYSGKADREIIANVKANVSIPVIGNGDIKDAESALSMLAETKCDAIMIGRAAQGNPFIFDEIRAALSGMTYLPPTDAERLYTALKHATAHSEYKTKAAFPEMRKHIAWYTHGMKGAAKLRNDIFSANSLDDVKIVLEKLLNADQRL